MCLGQLSVTGPLSRRSRGGTLDEPRRPSAGEAIISEPLISFILFISLIHKGNV